MPPSPAFSCPHPPLPTEASVTIPKMQVMSGPPALSQPVHPADGAQTIRWNIKPELHVRNLWTLPEHPTAVQQLVHVSQTRPMSGLWCFCNPDGQPDILVEPHHVSSPKHSTKQKKIKVGNAWPRQAGSRQRCVAIVDYHMEISVLYQLPCTVGGL